MEEKTNRIAEVMVSSVKPFELMMGKILGIAAVGLTQLVLWAILMTILSTAASAFLSSKNCCNRPVKLNQINAGKRQQCRLGMKVWRTEQGIQQCKLAAGIQLFCFLFFRWLFILCFFVCSHWQCY